MKDKKTAKKREQQFILTIRSDKKVSEFLCSEIKELIDYGLSITLNSIDPEIDENLYLWWKDITAKVNIKKEKV